MRVGVLGLGIMGSRMAANLARAGLAVGVWNRTGERAREWAEQHDGWVADSPGELAARSDIVVSMVVDEQQVRALVEQAQVHEGLLWIDCSTIGPAGARRIGQVVEQRGGRFLDAPVTGSAPRAQDGTLTVMVGGAQSDFDRAGPVFAAIGELVLLVGDLGQGQAVKVINNAVAAANTLAAAEALRVAQAAGCDLDALVAVMGAGSGGSAALETKQQAIRNRDYTPLFKLEHMLKDVRLCLELGTFPSADRALEALETAERSGHGEQDFSALAEGCNCGPEGL